MCLFLPYFMLSQARIKFRGKIKVTMGSHTALRYHSKVYHWLWKMDGLWVVVYCGQLWV